MYDSFASPFPFFLLCIGGRHTNTRARREERLLVRFLHLFRRENAFRLFLIFFLLLFMCVSSSNTLPKRWMQIADVLYFRLCVLPSSRFLPHFFLAFFTISFFAKLLFYFFSALLQNRLDENYSHCCPGRNLIPCPFTSNG